MSEDQRLYAAVVDSLSLPEPYQDVVKPDTIERQAQAVDLALTAGGRRYVLEHTLVEPFEQSTYATQLVKQVFPLLRKRLSGRLPQSGHYELVFPTGPTPTLRDVERTVDRIVEWVEGCACDLEICDSTDLMQTSHIRREKPSGLDFSVELRRWDGLDGSLFIARFSPSDANERQSGRLERALNAKLPKLRDAKAAVAGEATSVLVLEIDNFSLTNGQRICELATAEARGRPDRPDCIVVVDTSLSDEWLVWIANWEHGRMHMRHAVEPASLAELA